MKNDAFIKGSIIKYSPFLYFHRFIDLLVFILLQFFRFSFTRVQHKWYLSAFKLLHIYIFLKDFFICIYIYLRSGTFLGRTAPTRSMHILIRERNERSAEWVEWVEFLHALQFVERAMRLLICPFLIIFTFKCWNWLC